MVVTTLVMLVTFALISPSFSAMAVDADAIFSMVAPIRIRPVWPPPAEVAACCDRVTTSDIVPRSD